LCHSNAGAHLWVDIHKAAHVPRFACQHLRRDLRNRDKSQAA
jgi:hypothetical protein